MDIKQKTCKERVSAYLSGRIKDITKLRGLYCKDRKASDPDLGNMYEYGLCSDYVAPGTFKDQWKDYFRYQLSTGGPENEFRFYCDKQLNLYRIKYWFLDWFDGARRILTGKGKRDGRNRVKSIRSMRSHGA